MILRKGQVCRFLTRGRSKKRSVFFFENNDIDTAKLCFYE